MLKENLKTDEANKMFGLFTDTIIEEAFGVHDVRLTSNDLDAMFYYCLGSDDFEGMNRQTMIASYFSLKRTLEALAKKCFPESTDIVVKDPYFK